MRTLQAAIDFWNDHHPDKRDQIHPPSLAETGNNKAHYMGVLRSLLRGRVGIMDSTGGDARLIFDSKGAKGRSKPK